MVYTEVPVVVFGRLNNGGSTINKNVLSVSHFTVAIA
jgi:hypothetical protein